jgi:hypothetical protein
MQGGNYLPSVTGLDGVEPHDPVRNIFHMSASYHFSRHFFEAERDTCNPQPVCRIRTKRHSTGSPYDRICAIISDAIYHSNNPVLVRHHPDIGLDSWFPLSFIAGGDTGLQK